MEPIVLKVFSENLCKSVVFRVRPKEGVKPIQLICCASWDRVTQHHLVWIEDNKLFEQFLRFTQGIRLLQDDVATSRPVKTPNSIWAGDRE